MNDDQPPDDYDEDDAYAELAVRFALAALPAVILQSDLRPTGQERPEVHDAIALCTWKLALTMALTIPVVDDDRDTEATNG